MATFGSEVNGVFDDGLGGAGKFGRLFQLTEDGHVTKISAYLTGNGVRNAKAGIYSDNATQPNAPLGNSSEVVVPNGAGWVDFTVDINLTAGWYWLTIQFEGDPPQVGYVAALGGTCAWNYQGWNGFSNPFGAHTDNTWTFSIHADYTPSGGGVTVKKGSSLNATMMQMLNSRMLYSACNRFPKLKARTF